METKEVRQVLTEYMGEDAELTQVIMSIIEEAQAERPDGACKALAGYGNKLAHTR
jgi:hypothetical protein